MQAVTHGKLTPSHCHTRTLTHASDNDTTADSPLLRLPAELRERIYQYLLGYQMIHIRRKGNYPYGLAYPFFCSNTTHESDPNPMCRLDGPAAPETPFFARHSGCEKAYEMRRPRILLRDSLRILRTCRMIYREACLLPFESNTFLFSDIRPRDALVCFLRRLTAGQAAAVHHIVILSDRPQTGPGEPMPTPGYIAERLSGLRRLSYHIEFDDRDIALRFATNNGKEREDFKTDLEVFKPLSLRQLDLNVGCYQALYSELMDRRGTSRADFDRAAREWEDQVKNQLAEGA